MKLIGRKPTRFRPASFFLWTVSLLLVGLCLCYAHFVKASRQAAEQAPLRETAVRIVGSSDLAIYNAARYLRHVTLTDVSTPFQDCPGCFDYFPEAMSANPPGFAGIDTPMSFGAP
jgi:hypothetical protein